MADATDDAAALAEQFQSIAEYSLDTVTRMECVRDASGAVVDLVYTDMNEGGARLLSRPRDALLGRRFRELHRSAEAPVHLARILAVVETGEPWEYEVRVRDADVGAAWLLVRVVRFGDGVIHTARDTTEPRRAAETFDVYSTVVRSMSEGVCLVRVADGAMLYANPRFERTFGYAPGELVGRPAGVLLAPEWEVAPVYAALYGGGEASYETRNVRKDGARITCRAVTSTIEHPEHGRVWVTVLEDITARRQAEEARRRDDEAARYLAAIVEGSSDAIISSTHDGFIETWNRGAERLYGYTAEEVVGRSAQVIVPEERRAEVDAILVSVARGESGELRDTERLHKDGSLREVSVSYAPIRLADGTSAGLSTITRDISAAKAAGRQVAASLREKDALLQEVHHRVKNNLQVIMSLLKLQAGRVTDAQAREVFVESQSRLRSIALLHERLYQSKDFAHFDLSDYVRSLVQSLQRSHGASAERVDVTVHAPEVRIALDAAVPRGLIVNELLTNAFKHAFPPSRAGRGRVVIEVSRRGGAVEVVVCDDGVGLPEGFDVAQARTLGMHLMRTLARQLGGAVTVESGRVGVRGALSFEAP